MMPQLGMSLRTGILMAANVPCAGRHVLLEELLVEVARHAHSQDVDDGAADDLVHLEANGEDAVQESHEQTDRQCRQRSPTHRLFK